MNNLVNVFGKEFRTDKVKVNVFKGYWLEGNVVEYNEATQMLTLEIPTYYNPTAQRVEVSVNEVRKIKKIK